jgi:hypothetical protein
MDRMKIQILDDGTIKSTTDEVSPENHSNAEAFLKLIASLTGGESHRVARGDAAVHHHHHHGGVTHSHGGGQPHSH